MSEDALYIVRAGGVDAHYHSKWGGLGVDRLLLQHGPDAVVERLRGYPAWQYGVPAGWLTAYVLVDVDRRSLLYWASQFAYRDPFLLRCFSVLLEHQWTGWSTRWPVLPACELGDAIGGDTHAAIDRADPAVHPPVSADDLRHSVVPVEELGLGTRAWVTVRDTSGTRDYLVEGTVEHPIEVGPALLDQLGKHAPIGDDDLDWYDDTPTLFVDVIARRVVACCPDRGFVMSFDHAGSRWPGWDVSWHSLGPRGHWVLTGRPDGEVADNLDRMHESLCATYARRLENQLDESTRADLRAIVQMAEVRYRAELA